MNILYFSSKKRWRGVVSWMKITALGLESRGHRVYIISHPGCKIVREKELRVIPLRPGFDYNPFTIIRLIKFIRKNRIDLIVTNIKREVNQGGIAARICRIPNIRRIGTEKDFNNPRVRKKVKYIDHVVSPCRYMIEDIRNKFPELESLSMSCIYNGRPLLNISRKEKEKTRRKFTNGNQLLIGICCQISKAKNLIGVLNVFRLLIKKHPDIKLIIAGEGPQEEDIRQYISSQGLENDVFMTGFSPEAFKYASVFDISVLFSNLEGFSNSVVEYMAAGSAVICTDVGGQREIITHNYNGFIIKPGDERALYKKLDLLIRDKDLRNVFSRNGLKTIEENFTETRMIDRLEELYKGIIKDA